MVRHMRQQSGYCAQLGSPFYSALLERLADDVEAGGPAASVLAGHETDRGRSALALRLMGSVHRLVLERVAPRLALHYPSVGGDGDPAAAWPALRDVLADHGARLRGLLDQPPQTNEVGRAAVLAGGLAHVVAWRDRPVRLVEIGASGGLNLRVDHFRVESADRLGVGPPDSPVVLRDAWTGATPPRGPAPRVVERLGCDLSPVDATSTEGRLLLTSYVWPDQSERLERLRAALEVARSVPVALERAGAGDFVRRLELAPGTTTVLWHSIMWQYLDPAEQASVDESLDRLGATAGEDRGLVRISLEPARRNPTSPREMLVRMRTWPGGEERFLGAALTAHGLPVVWDEVAR
jgi:hypothetical protein